MRTHGMRLLRRSCASDGPGVMLLNRFCIPDGSWKGLLAAFLLWPTTQVWAAAVGEVVYATGLAEVINGAAVRGAKSALVYEGDRLRTGADGHIYLRTYDGGFFILRPDSEGVVVRYGVNPKLGQAAYRLELVQGLSRVVTGKEVKRSPERFRLNTPIAAIGVRGTDFTVASMPTYTRAWVDEGRIVMASLGEGCPADALGPCHDGGALELSPEHIAAAEINANSQVPTPLPPDVTRPEIRLPMDAPAVPLSSDKSKRVNGQIAQPAETQVHSVSTPADATRRAPQWLRWGRWQPLADLPANIDVRQLNAQIVAISDIHILLREAADNLTMPHEGKASFRLGTHEGYYIKEGGGPPQEAQVQDAALLVDFAQRTFTTQLKLSGKGQPDVAIATHGTISPDGRLTSQPLSLSHISGALAGEQAREAAYLYQQLIDQTTSVKGATFWWR